MKIALPVATLLAASLAATIAGRADESTSSSSGSAKNSAPVPSIVAVAPVAPLQLAGSEAIPFRPPTVHRGWGPEQKRRFSVYPRPRNGWNWSGQARDLMFRDEDRDTFQAVHPFLLQPEVPIETRRLEPRSRPQGGRFYLLMAPAASAVETEKAEQER